MPPHCDAIDGPVATAARAALAAHDVSLALPYVRKEGESEVISAFNRANESRDGNVAVNELAELFFSETLVRVHRRGEGAPYTGLKPAGLPVGPVIPVAERAIDAGDPTELVELLVSKVTTEVHRRFTELTEARRHATEGVDQARTFVESSLGLQVWSHRLYLTAESPAHGDDPESHADEGGHRH